MERRERIRLHIKSLKINVEILNLKEIIINDDLLKHFSVIELNSIISYINNNSLLSDISFSGFAIEIAFDDFNLDKFKKDKFKEFIIDKVLKIKFDLIGSEINEEIKIRNILIKENYILGCEFVDLNSNNENVIARFLLETDDEYSPSIEYKSPFDE